MATPEINIGTRGSKLALIQTQIVTQALQQKFPNLQFKVKVIKTSGDRGKITTVGAFVGELEKALLKKEIDIAIHSFKDMPSVVTPGLTFSAMLKRADASEALVLKNGELFDDQKEYTIGTGSPRRKRLLNHYYPNIKVVPVRGNVDTRIAMVDFGQINGLILAAAGLIRLGIEERISKGLEIGKFIPAPGQGVLAVQTREDDKKILNLVSPLDDENTRICARAERIILEKISGGCSIPLGAYAQFVAEDRINMIAFYGYTEEHQINIGEITFSKDEIDTKSKELAIQLKSNFIS